MKTKMRLKTGLALLLTLVMLFSVMTPMMSFMATALTVDTDKVGANTKLTSKTDYAVAPGITESHIITHNKDGSNQVQAYALEVDLSNSNVGILASYKNYMGNLAASPTWGFQTVRDQAVAAENYYRAIDENFDVVGGVNGDYFNMQFGYPTGPFVMNGTTYNENNSWNYFAILDDGKAVIGSGTVPANAKELVGGPSILIRDGQIVADPTNPDMFPRTSVGITAEGKVIFVTADGRQAPSSCGQTIYENAQQMLSLGCVDALQLDGGGSATLVSQREGEESLQVRNSPSDGTEREVSTSLLIYSTAKPDGVFDHANLAPVNELYTPGSTVTFTATGVDGAGSAVELPAEGAYALANAAAGTIDPATGVFTAAEGYVGDVTVNYVVGEAVKGSTTVSIVVPDELYVASTEQAVGPGITTDFGIVAKYQDRDVVMKAGDIDWTIVDQSTNADLNGVAGTFNGLTFTGAEENAYNAKVTATLKCNTALVLNLTVFIGSKQVTLHDFEYVTGEENKEADNYIKSYTLPTYSATWLTNNSNAGYPSRTDLAKALYAQDYPLYMWPNANVTDVDNTSATATVVSAEDGEPVRFGDKSLRIEFDYANYNFNKNANFYLRETTPPYRYEGSPTAIGCWIYAPEGTTAYHLYLQCAGQINVEANDGAGSGTGSYQCLTSTDNMGTETAGINWTGWRYLEFDLTGLKGRTGVAYVGGAYEPYGQKTDNGIFWISFQPSNMGYNVTADTIYIDDITLIYGANTSDTINPKVNYIGGLVDPIVDGETVYTSNTNTFKASYADVEDKYMTGIDDTATKMYIDGVDVTDKCYINAGDDEIYFYDAVLPDGVHNIEIEVADVFGNKTTEMRYFTIDSNTEDTEVSFEAVNIPYLGDDYKLAITTNNAANIAAADVEVKVLSNFTSYWRDVTVEPAANYNLVGEAAYNSIKDTLTFKVERKADAAPENDDGTIATIITRVPTNTPANLEVTHRIAKGALTYTEATGDKFVTGFSDKITSTCSALLTVDTDIMIVGAPTGNVIVTDTETKEPVAGAEVYNANGDVLLGTTDENGVLATGAFTGAVQQFEIYAMQKIELTPADPENNVEATYKTLRSFNYKTQSYEPKGDATGLPSYIKLNASEDSSTQQSISWMSNPLYTADKAMVRYILKSEYDAYNDPANDFSGYTEYRLNGTSYLSEMMASGKVETNYTVRLNSVTLTGLKPDTEYVYVVGDGTTWSDYKSFKTQRAGTDTDFFIIGDIQSEDTTDVNNIKNALAATNTDFDFGLQTGDLVDNGADFKYWDAVAGTFSTDILGSTDIVHVLGNHEYYGDLAGINSAHYFSLPGEWTDEAPIAYSFEYGNVYVASFGYINLATYEKACEWLKEDAAASTANWKILSMHQPPYFTNPGGATNGLQELISATCDAADIDFVLSGHDHSYARTEPLTAGEVDKENGTVYIICGSTGEKGYDIINNPDHHYAAMNETYDAVYMTVSTTDTTLEIRTYNCVRATGESELIDSYTATKAVTCTPDGHDFVLDDEWLTCSVCGYTRAVEGYTGLAKDVDSGLLMKIDNGAALKNIWVDIDGAIYYFAEDGVALAGTQKVGEYEYPFDENGVLTKFAIVKDGALVANWWTETADGVFHLGADGLPDTGETKIGEYTYPLDETGKLTKLTFVKDDGTLGTHIWLTNPDSGKLNYLGDDGLPVTGAHKIACDTADGKTNFTYTFDENGDLVKGAFSKSGIYTYYWIAGLKQRNWFEIDGYWYYFDRQTGYGMATLENDGKINADKVKDGKYPITSTDSTLLFTFDKNGRLVEGALNVTDNGTVYYWGNNERLTGWHYVGGDIYYFGDDFYAVTGEQTIGEKTYTFSAEGKLQLKEENFEINGTFYYYDVNGVIVKDHITDHPYTKAVLDAAAPDCDDTGLTAGEKCSVCDFVLVAQKTVDADGHKHTPVVTPPTCTEKGFTTYTCSVCGDTYTDDEVAATGHTAGEWTVVTPADIGIEGLEQLKCTVCDAVIDSKKIPAIVPPTTEPPTTEPPTTEPPTTDEPDSETTEPVVYYKVGDSNRDGKVTAADARIALRYAAKIDIPATSKDFIVADVNFDNKINALDARKILRVAAGLDKSF